MTYNDTFRDRLGRSNDAKKKALEMLKARPKVDPAELAARKAARLAREQAEADERAAKAAAIEQAKRDAEEAARQAEEARLAEIEAEKAKAAEAAAATRNKLAAAFAMPTAEERLASRESRYPARKARKNG